MHHRIYASELMSNGEVVVSGDEFHHASRVVRVREGENVELFDGRGRIVAGRVVAIGRDEIRVAVDREVPSRESPLQVTLAMAIIQPDKFELVLQKATELGAYAFIPLITDRVELRPERYRGKTERWRKIVFEAVKQCGRSLLPAIAEPTPLADALRRSGTKVVFDADAEPTNIQSYLGPTLFIGPEGGWSEGEIEAAREAGCGFLRLGPRRLRAETAAIAAIVLVAARTGDV